MKIQISDNPAPPALDFVRPSRPKWIVLSVSRPACFLIAAVLLFAAGLYAGARLWRRPAALTPASAAAAAVGAGRATDYVQRCRPGPWGELEYIPITIEPPTEYIRFPDILPADIRWFFPGYTAGTLAALLGALELTPAERAQLLDRAQWQVAADGITLNPTPAVIRSLAQPARKAIYEVLLTQVTRNRQLDFFALVPAEFEDHFALSHLPRATIELVRELSYRRGEVLFFADLPLVLATLPDYAQKIALVKALTRRPTLLLRLRVRPDSDLKALNEYWVRGPWGKDVRPVLDALARVPGGAPANIVFLLPGNPSANLNTFPFPPRTDADLQKDCHWTSLNFFRDTSDEPFTNSSQTAALITRDYVPVTTPARYGDLLLITRLNGDVIHSAVFIADDIVFTKNGASYLVPTILMKIPDLLAHFTCLVPEGEPLKAVFYRPRNF